MLARMTRALVPEDLRRNGLRSADYLARACFAHAHHIAQRAKSQSPEEFARQRCAVTGSLKS
jgi:hypothetical protein